jgi:hypothetical protein
MTNLSGTSALEMAIEDLSGRAVYSSNGHIPAGNGSYQFTWDATEVKSGLYIYRVRLNGTFYSGKIVKM